MTEGDEASEIRTLLGQRADVLAVLVEGQYDKSTLTDELGVSRSTIDRTVRRLETSGLVSRDGCGVEATRAGRLAYDAYRTFCAETESVARFCDLLRELPPDAEIGHDLLRDATAFRSEPPTPGRPANEVTALISQASRVRACATVISDSAAVTTYHRMITERDGSGSVVVSHSLADYLSEEYFQTQYEMVSTGRHRIYEIDELPYELFLIDTDERVHVVVLIYTDSGRLHGCLVNDTDAARAWGEETFERYRDAAAEITGEFLV